MICILVTELFQPQLRRVFFIVNPRMPLPKISAKFSSSFLETVTSIDEFGVGINGE